VTSSSRLGSPPEKPKTAARGELSLPRGEVSVLDVLNMPDVALWDVRPYQERIAEPGYIPGSRSVCMTTRDAMGLPWNKITDWTPCVVLVCLSGRRSGSIAAELWAAGHERVLQLRGGILEWLAVGLPLCVPSAPEPEDWAAVASLDEFRREATSCFVAEAILSYGTSSNEEFVSPKLLMDRVFAESDALASFDRALLTLDLLAENARRLGHPMDRLAANLSVMRTVLQRLEQHGQFRH
jgi:rhodanese-related sulfurtransferase